MEPSRLYVDLQGFTQSPQEKRGKSRRKFWFSSFFQSFSSPDFAKISAAVLRIDLVRSRAPETNIWPISSEFSIFFSFLLTPKIWKSNFFPLFLKEQALKPCPGPRSRDSAQIRKIESSPNPNLTDLVKKEGRDFHRNPQPSVYLPKNTFWLLGVTDRKKGKSKIPLFFHFPLSFSLKN